MKKKLSATQEKALAHIRQQVEEARQCSTYEEYFQAHDSKYLRRMTVEEFRDQYPQDYELHVKWWKDHQAGLALVQASGPTVKKLEALGYIRIVEDTTGGGSYRSDIVQLL